MTSSDLSPAITKYFDLMNGPDKTRVAEVFTTDAVVSDDGQAYHGREAILGWLAGPASEHTTTSTRLSAEQSGATALVVILLEGDFPGGRVVLRHEFEQGPAGLINALTIAA